MHDLKLRRILGHDRVGDLLRQIMAAHDATLSVHDADGGLIFGGNQAAGDEYPIPAENGLAGSVRGGKHAQFVASLLSLLWFMERERKCLGQETLQRYSELHLLYGLSRLLAHSPAPGLLAETLLSGASQYAGGDFGAVVLLGKGASPEFLAVHGDKDLVAAEFIAGKDLWREISNEAAPRIVFKTSGQGGRSPLARSSALLCAPLQAMGKVLGVCALWSLGPRKYTEQQATLLSALGTHAAAAISYDKLSNALLSVVDVVTEASSLMVDLTLPEASGAELDILLGAQNT